MDLLLMLALVVSVIVGALWWGLVIFGIIKGAQYFGRRYEQQLKSLEALQQQWEQITPQERASKQAQLGLAFQQLRQLSAQVNNITRQRYENRVSQLTGLAGRAGINWHP
jgi:predicted PurR-regulated permease PerM